MRQSWSVNNLTDFVVDSVQNAHADDAPFHHLRFDRVFPDDFYAEMLLAMPVADDYRAMSNRFATRSSVFTSRSTCASVWAAVQEIRSRLWEAAGLRTGLI